MTKLVFTKLPDPDNEYDRTKVEFAVEHDALPEIVSSFEDFLRGCGFNVEMGSLQIVGEEE